jgi:DNA-binding NarL/FixJ family response regulator
VVDDVDWPFVGRVVELEMFSRLIADPASSGVVLAGPAGVGKTRMAAECLTVAGGDSGCFVARVAGQQASSELPFGALTHLLPTVGPGHAVLRRIDHTQEAMRQDLSGLLRQLASAVTTMAGGRRLVLLVDDAHLLDRLSATLVYQLALNDSAFILATLRAGEIAPDPVVALWKDGLLVRHELPGLPVEATEQLVSAALKGQVDPETTLSLASHCHGNVLYLRELVKGAVRDGTLRYELGMWRLVRELQPSIRLVELVEATLCGLVTEERELLELVSLGEPLEQNELQVLGDIKVAERLERSGLLKVQVNNGRLQVRLGHPVYGDVLRAGLPKLRVATMSRALAESVEDTGSRRDEAMLRIGRWRLIGGGGSPEVMLAAATAARWRYDFRLAQRLTQAAQELGGGFEADLMAAKLASIQGGCDTAESALAMLAKDTTDDAQRAKVAIARMDNFLFANRPTVSLQVATEAETYIGDRYWRDEITARRSAILVNTEGPYATLRAVTPLLAGSTSDTALVWACLTGARSLARVGRCEEAVKLTERGHHAQMRLSEPLEFYPWFHLFNRAEAFVSIGRLDDAEALASSEYQTGLAEHSAERQACFALQLAKVHLARGRVRDAAASAREAVGVTRRIGRPLFLHEALHNLAMARAHTDNIVGADIVLAKVEEFDLPRTFYDAPDALLARAWTAAAHRQLPHARELAEEAAELALTSGDLVVASAALHTLARFGAAGSVTARLDRLENQIDPGLINLRAAHARHLASDDANGLQETADAFAAMGFDLLAADAAADAAVAWTRQGHTRNAAAASRLSVALADKCQGATTPSLRSVTARARLTPAEHETATLAAAGHSNKDIADELVLSVRSIENRLQRVYEKLGITTRSALPDALALPSRTVAAEHLNHEERSPLINAAAHTPRRGIRP